MESELSKIVSRKYDINFPNELIQLILSFDLEISFDLFLHTQMHLEMVIRINITSFYDDVLEMFRREYYKECNERNLQIKDRKKLKKQLKEMIFMYKTSDQMNDY